MSRGFDVKAEEQDRKSSEAMVGFSSFGFLSGQTDEHRQVRNRARGEFLFVQREEIREVARRRRIVQTKFCDRLCQSAREAGRLSDGSEIRQPVRGGGGVDDARGDCFDAEAGDGSDGKASHGLRGELGGELRESECVNALAAGWEGVGDEFRRGGSCGSDDEDFGMLGFFSEECGGAVEKCGVGAGVNERARGHRQLYWVEIRKGAALSARNGEILVIVVTNLRFLYE